MAEPEGQPEDVALHQPFLRGVFNHKAVVVVDQKHPACAKKPAQHGGQPIGQGNRLRQIGHRVEPNAAQEGGHRQGHAGTEHDLAALGHQKEHGQRDANTHARRREQDWIHGYLISIFL